jgi:tRNA(Ile)-lysidine synthase
MTADLYSRFKTAAIGGGLVVSGDTVLVAYSGGPDSTALLRLLLELRKDVPFKVVVAHFNHMLRRDAEADERFVRAQARALKLRLAVGRRDVKRFARARRRNVEEAARLLRYEFLEKAAIKTGATKIATGHTLNDQAETVLLRLLRGSGKRGLSGIHPAVEGRIIRPLLGFTRSEIEDYLGRKKLGFRTDRTNFDTRLLRNKVRMRLIPYLRRRFAPNIVPILGRTASILAGEDEALDRLVRQKERRAILLRRGMPTLEAKALLRESRGLARGLVRRLIERNQGDLRRITFEDIEAVLDLGEGHERTLPGGLRLRRSGGAIAPVVKSSVAPPFQYRWRGTEPLEIREAEVLLVKTKMKKRPGAAPHFDDRRRCFCDAAAVHFPLVVRSRHDGDRYRPIGAPGRQKLNELLRARGVPAEDRGRIPVICSGRDIVWVPGLPVAESFKIRPETRTIFRIDAKRMTGI